MTRPIFLHIGVSKSGTSSLQEGLRRSRDRLAEAGLGQPLDGRAMANGTLLAPLGWTHEEGFVEPVDVAALRPLGALLRRTTGDRLVISCEDLADAPQDAVEALSDVLRAADLEPHVIVTARSWARQLPAEYQQFLKVALTQTYDEFLRDVRDDRGEPASPARRFRARQQLSRIVDTWSPLAVGGRVDVVAVPPFSVDPTFVYRSMSQLLGVAEGDLQDVGDEVNGSFGSVEVELLRRINVSARKRLRPNEEYARLIRRVLVRQTIKRGASPRLTLPPEHLPWVREAAESELAWLRDGGHALHGDAEGLLPADGDVKALPDVDDAQLARVAVNTLVDFALRTDRLRRRHEWMAAEAAEQGEGTVSAGPGRTTGRLARGVARRVRR